jgi:hypothetical protein
MFTSALHPIAPAALVVRSRLTASRAGNADVDRVLAQVSTTTGVSVRAPRVDLSSACFVRSRGGW